MVCDEVSSHWHLGYLFASIGMSFLGSYAAVSLAEYLRSYNIINKQYTTPYFHLGLLSFTLGGGTIWCMHFVGMGALQLHTSHNGVIKQEYDLGLTMISLILCIFFVYFGSYIATLDTLYTKERHELFQELIKSCTLLSVGNLQNKWVVFRIVMLHGTAYIIVGGLLTGVGICIMHYIGMMAMINPVEVQWDYGIITASVLVACGAAIVAFWILFRILALYPQSECIRIISSFVMTVAICGMHYSGMAAASYCYQPGKSLASLTGTEMPLDSAIIPVISGGLIFDWLMIMLILSHSRRQFYDMRNEMRTTKQALEEISINFDRSANDADKNCKVSKADDKSSFFEVTKPLSQKFPVLSVFAECFSPPLPNIKIYPHSLDQTSSANDEVASTLCV